VARASYRNPNGNQVAITHFSYLLFHIVIVASLFVSKFLYKPMKLPLFEKVWKVIALGSAPLLLLDLAVTDWFWWFAESKILPLPKVLSIPVEEFLFFVTVPYALLTLHENLATIPTFNKQILSNKGVPLMVLLFGLWGTFLGAVGWLYTASMCVLLSLSLIIASRYTFVKTVRFVVVLGLALLLTAIFNMYLTAVPIVLYDVTLKSNLLLGTIPFEDFLFGTILVIHLFIAKQTTI
jgi:lycopene cyclase domain-containing protein